MIGRSATPSSGQPVSGRFVVAESALDVARQSSADDAEPFHAELARRPEHLALARVNRRNTS